MRIEGRRRWESALGPHALRWLVTLGLAMASLLVVLAAHAVADWKTERDHRLVQTEPRISAAFEEAWCGRGCWARIDVGGQRFGLTHDLAVSDAMAGERIDVVADPVIPRRFVPVADAEYWEVAGEEEPLLVAGVTAFVVLILFVWVLVRYVFSVPLEPAQRGRTDSPSDARAGPVRRVQAPRATKIRRVGAAVSGGLVVLTALGISAFVSSEDDRYAHVAASGERVQATMIGWSELEDSALVEVAGARYLLVRGYEGRPIEPGDRIAVVHDPEADDTVLVAEATERWRAEGIEVLWLWGLPPAIALIPLFFIVRGVWPRREDHSGSR